MKKIFILLLGILVLAGLTLSPASSLAGPKVEEGPMGIFLELGYPLPNGERCLMIPWKIAPTPIIKWDGKIIKEGGYVKSGELKDLTGYDEVYFKYNRACGEKIDGQFVHTKFKPGFADPFIIWDLGRKVHWVRVYPVQNHLGCDLRTGKKNINPHNPYDSEYHEYTVFVSNDMASWTQARMSILYVEGRKSDPAVGENGVKDYFLTRPCRYVKIVPVLYGSSCDFEIDAVLGWEQDC